MRANSMFWGKIKIKRRAQRKKGNKLYLKRKDGKKARKAKAANQSTNNIFCNNNKSIDSNMSLKSHEFIQGNLLKLFCSVDNQRNKAVDKFVVV